MTHRSSIAILKFASLFVIGFGLLMFTTLFTPTREALFFFQDLAFLPIDGGQGAPGEVAWLWTAISGGVLVGWGLLFWLVTTQLYVSDPTIGRRIILPSILAWFLVDGSGSVIVGAWFNVVMNSGFLALFALPVLLLKSDAAAAAA